MNQHSNNVYHTINDVFAIQNSEFDGPLPDMFMGSDIGTYKDDYENTNYHDGKLEKKRDKIKKWVRSGFSKLPNEEMYNLEDDNTPFTEKFHKLDLHENSEIPKPESKSSEQSKKNDLITRMKKQESVIPDNASNDLNYNGLIDQNRFKKPISKSFEKKNISNTKSDDTPTILLFKAANKPKNDEEKQLIHTNNEFLNDTIDNINNLPKGTSIPLLKFKNNTLKSVVKRLTHCIKQKKQVIHNLDKTAAEIEKWSPIFDFNNIIEVKRTLNHITATLMEEKTLENRRMLIFQKILYELKILAAKETKCNESYKEMITATKKVSSLFEKKNVDQYLLSVAKMSEIDCLNRSNDEIKRFEKNIVLNLNQKLIQLDYELVNTSEYMKEYEQQSMENKLFELQRIDNESFIDIFNSLRNQRQKQKWKQLSIKEKENPRIKDNFNLAVYEKHDPMFENVYKKFPHLFHSISQKTNSMGPRLRLQMQLESASILSKSSDHKPDENESVIRIDTSLFNNQESFVDDLEKNNWCADTIHQFEDRDSLELSDNESDDVNNDTSISEKENNNDDLKAVDLDKAINPKSYILDENYMEEKSIKSSRLTTMKPFTFQPSFNEISDNYNINTGTLEMKHWS